jgi:DNA polymerase-4
VPIRVEAQTGCCIAVSYQAKAYGVKTGFERRYLPQALYSLELEDIPGIGKRMEQRILAEGITTMRQLCALTRERMHTIWGGVLGDRLWLWLRREDFLEPPARPLQTLSRQHILPPDCRTPDKARAVALKLLHSTARKMAVITSGPGGHLHAGRVL